MNKKIIIPAIALAVVGSLVTFLLLAQQKEKKVSDPQDSHAVGLDHANLAPESNDSSGSNEPIIQANITSPEDELVTYELGDIEISTYNPSTVTSIETSTNLYFIAQNNSDQEIQVQYQMPQPGDANPDEDNEPRRWQHFFWLQDTTQTISPNEQKTFEFVVVPEQGGDFEYSFGFVNLTQSIQKDLEISFHIQGQEGVGQLGNSGIIQGLVMDKNQNPIPNIEVKAYLYNASSSFFGTSDRSGNYQIRVPGLDDIQKLFGSRTRPYATLAYYITVDDQNYDLHYTDGLEPRSDQPVTHDITLEQRQAITPAFEKTGEYTSDLFFGYWWVLPQPGFDSFAAVQGRHPPELNQPGHIIGLDDQANKLWEIQTNDECWGMDISKDGLVAAACHEGTIYVADSQGNLLWTRDAGGQTRDISFSNDGSMLMFGPYQTPETRADFAVVNARDGSLIWASEFHDEWLRNSQFSPDDQRVIAGLSGGRVECYNILGQKLWENFIGEFPMLFEIDGDYNVYGAGKNRELFSYDRDGALRWRYAISNHVVTAGSNSMTRDGSMLVMGTVGAHLLAIDQNGTLLWQQHLLGELQGHNALDMTPDGEYILVGTAGLRQGGWLMLFDKSGNLLWSEEKPDRRTPQTAQYEYDHNQSGAITVAISDDGTKLIAGYGDSTIQIYEQKL